MKLYNTLTRQKEEFVPLEPGKVKMYVCGPTVYNFFHIGNARTFLVFDALRRYLEYKGMEVTYVQNFTDVDDKLIRRAAEENTTFDQVADRYIGEYFTDSEGLGIHRATVHPRATENIGQIIELVQALVDKGFAYEAQGDVYYRTKAFNGYGKLSHQPLEDLEAGARIAVGEHKEDPMDFALWKAAKPEEPSWDSPWGKGRPGWHIECSAMARRYLGETIDIHAGGADLCFPHHENEIAQSEAANGKPFARYWLHAAYLNVDNRKMGKSEGNFFMTRDAAKEYGYAAIRFFILSAQYRSPLNFTQDSLSQAKAALERIQTAAQNLRFLQQNAGDGPMTADEAQSIQGFDGYRERFCQAMDDDLNTADAISVIFELVREGNTRAADPAVTKAYATQALGFLTELCQVLGLETAEEDKGLDSDIEALIAQRQQARKDRDFAEADRIRDELKSRGITLEDTPQGVKWSRA